MKNSSRSIADRLLNISKKSGEDNTFVLMRYGVERLLYRISKSSYSEMFILKGATLFLIWNGHGYRTTKDIDFLGAGEPDSEKYAAIFMELCTQDLSAIDGLKFLPESVRAVTIQNNQEFQGVRITLRALLERARIDLQVDIGFGDVITPGPEKVNFPTLLDMPAPVIMAYQKYSAMAEKFMAMVTLGMENSRLKDFYDMCIMFRTMEFDQDILIESVKSAFKARNNQLPDELPVILTTASLESQSKIIQWNAFVNRSMLSVPIGRWTDVVLELRTRLSPVFKEIRVKIE